MFFHLINRVFHHNHSSRCQNRIGVDLFGRYETYSLNISSRSKNGVNFTCRNKQNIWPFINSKTFEHLCKDFGFWLDPRKTVNDSYFFIVYLCGKCTEKCFSLHFLRECKTKISWFWTENNSSFDKDRRAF